LTGAPVAQTSTGLPPDPAVERVRRFALQLDLEHLHGPADDSLLERDEMAVVCVVRNGRPYIRAFVAHYLALGARRIVFLDNGSTDDTVEAVKKHAGVTVLRSALPFKRYQMTMKQYLIERFGRGGWSLCVDVDELFDYPFSNVVKLEDFLGYLNERGYTAVVAQMLDMFPEGLLSESSQEEDEPLKERHRFYDLSNVHSYEYRSNAFVCGSGNVISNPEIRGYKDGIQQTIFGIQPLLTKHPLVFLDGEIRPMNEWAHSVGGARIADISCVLFHYKFIPRLYEHVRRAVLHGNYPNRWGKYEKMAGVLERNPNLQIKRESARELGSVNELVANGFLTVSREYLQMVCRKERSHSGEEGQGGANALIEAFFGARGEAEAQAIRAQRMGRRVRKLGTDLREEHSTVRRLQGQIRELEKSLQDGQTSVRRRWIRRIKDLRERVSGS
jgi:glycosyltransferase involved in cell wall biosynthesis